MPARRRHRGQPDQPVIDPVTQFGLLLKESADRQKRERERTEQAKRDKANAAQAAKERADALHTARRRLDRAIDAVKEARARRSGVVEADIAWRAAKALVIELETGAAPEWAGSTDDTDAEGAGGDAAAADVGVESADEAPSQD